MLIALIAPVQRRILQIAAITSVALVVACNPETSDSSKTSASDSTAATNNTGINDRDQQAAMMTPTDQSQSSEELARVASLRSALMGLNDLSVSGQNIKIITGDGRITLRGPVADAAERARIEAAMTAAANGAPINSQLELAPAP